MKKLLLLLFFLSCKQEPSAAPNVVYHAVTSNIVCNKVREVYYGIHGYECMSVSTGNKYDTVYGLTNVVKLEIKE